MTTTEKTNPTKPPGFISLLGGILFKPRVTFTRIKENGRRAWIIVAVIAIILVMLPPIVSGPITARQSAEAFQQAQEQFGNQTAPDGSEIIISEPPAFISSPIFTTLFPAVGGVIVLILGWLLWSGTLHLLGSMVGGRNTFNQMLQTVVWAWIPFGIRNIIQAIYIAVTGELIAHPGLSGFVASEPPPDGAFFTPPDTGQLILQSFLGRIDIYLFWNLALLLIGVTVMSQLPRRKALGILLIVWAVFTLLSLAPALLGGIAAGAMG